MRRLRLPASSAEIIANVALLGAVPMAVGFSGAFALYGIDSPPGWIPSLLKLGLSGLGVMGACGGLLLMEKAGRLVFVTPPEEAELMRDRQLKLEGPGAEPMRDVPPAISKEPPRPLWGPAKAVFGAGVACWVLCFGGLFVEVSSDVLLRLGGAGLALSLAALGLAFSGELVRAVRVLRADDGGD